MQMTVEVVNRRGIRHAHMVNIERRIMLEGMRADFLKVDELSASAVLEIGAIGQRHSRPHRRRHGYFGANEPVLSLKAQDQRDHQHRRNGATFLVAKSSPLREK